MGQARIPGTAAPVERDYGLFADGARLDAVLWRHTPRHGDTETYWIERSWSSDRHTQQYGGPKARKRALSEWAELVEVLAESRKEHAARAN